MRKFQIAMMLAAAGLMTSMASAQGFGDSTTTTQTTTSTTTDGDSKTTTTHSETTSHGADFNFGSFFGPRSGGPSGPTYETLGGSWQIGETKGDKLCDLTLEPKKFISSYGARTGIGCPEGLFGVGSWILAGNEIRLTTAAGTLLATLHPAGNNRWNGRTTAGLDIFMTKQ